jgi:hypothetical protein
MNDRQILELNQKHPYYTQLQGQMAVTGLQMGHFFVWSPKGSLQSIVNFDPMFWVHLQGIHVKNKFLAVFSLA